MEETARPMAGQMSPGRTRFSVRARRGVMVVAAAVALLTVATVGLVTNTPTASAITGRRVCAYINAFDDYVEVSVPMASQLINVKEYVAVNYTKNRDCPHVNRPFGEDGEMPTQQPVEQFTCEEYPSHIGIEWTTGETTTSGQYLGRLSDDEFPVPWSPDVCANMLTDTVYLFYVIPEDHPELGVKKGDYLVQKAEPSSIWSYE